MADARATWGVSSVLAATICAGTGMAADAPALANKAAPVANAHHWTGVYGGIHGGVATGRATNSFPPAFGAFDGIFGSQTGGSFRQDFDRKGAVGLHVGANWQTGHWVVGLEGTYSRTGFDTITSDPFNIAGLVRQLNYETKLNWIATITPRLGYASGRWLIYGKGGLAAGRAEALLTSSSPGTIITFQEQGIHVGWTLGGGVEFALSPNWILGLEYNHYNLGEEQFGGTMLRNGFRDESGQYDLGLRADALTARLSYFWAPDDTASAVSAFASASTTNAAMPGHRGWAGFYVGAHGGYGWATAENAHPPSTGFLSIFSPYPAQAATFDQSVDGWILGGHIGLNYQVGRWVFGLEGAVTSSGLKGTSTGVFAGLGADAAATYETKLDWLATLTPRIGLDFGDWMPYVKAGLALGQVTSTLSTPTNFGMFSPGPHTFNETNNYLGWTFGAGVECRVSQNWIAGFEYSYISLGNEHFGGLAANGNGIPNEHGEYDVGLTLHAAMARLSYRP